MSFGHFRLQWLSLALFTVFGCADTAGTGPPLTVFSDSAGIRIAENQALPETLVWREMDESGVVTLADTEDGTLLWNVRDVTRLQSGRIAVLNAGSHEVLVFDSVGRVVSRFGREGDGPGEFRLPFSMLGLAGDSMAVVDANGRRTLFGPDGEYVSQVNTRLAGSNASSFIPDTPLPDGSVVARTVLLADGPPPSGPFRQKIPWEASNSPFSLHSRPLPSSRRADPILGSSLAIPTAQSFGCSMWMEPYRC